MKHDTVWVKDYGDDIDAILVFVSKPADIRAVYGR